MAFEKNLSVEEKQKLREEAKQRVDNAMAKIEEGVKTVFTSDSYKNYLSFMSKFYNYSINNTILIYLQKPDATLVAGFGKWKTDFHRNVNKGEKSISILAPVPYKTKREVNKTDEFGNIIINKETGKPETETQVVDCLGFKIVPVFDIGQTSGEPIPSFISELRGTNQSSRELFSAVREVSDCSIVILSDKKDSNLKGGAKGYYSPARDIIVIKDEMSDIQKAKTVLHEYAHSQLHKDPDSNTSREQKEIEAESVAFVLCQHFGIDTSDYSFPYIASWSSGKESEELKEILDNISSKALELIEKIEPAFEKRLEKLQENREERSVEDMIDK